MACLCSMMAGSSTGKNQWAGSDLTVEGWSHLEGSSLACQVIGAGHWLGPQPGLPTATPNIWPLHVAWASPQHGGSG